MSELIFKKLQIKDFRVYKGEHSIEFSTNPNKKLTLVHAENSTGKTTMLNAIKWCLYGETPDFEDKTRLVNSQSGKNSCSVKLNFIFDEQEYQASRSYNQIDTKSDIKLFKVNQYGSLTPENEEQALINGLLPKELSNFFLFAGEQFAKEYIDKPENHRRAIRNILGFDLAERAIDDLEKIKKDNLAKIKSLAKENSEISAAAKEIDRLEKLVENLNEEKAEVKKDISVQTEIIKIAQQNIDNSDHKSVKKLRLILKEQESSRDTQKKLLVEKFKLKNSLVSSYGYCIFGLKFSKSTSEFIEEKESDSGMPSDFGRTFVNRLLKNKECCCGRPLKENTAEFRRIEGLIDTATTQKVNDKIRYAKGIEDDFAHKSKEFIEKLSTLETQITNIEAAISGYEAGIEDTKNHLKGLKDANIEKDIIDRDNAMSEKSKLQARVISIDETKLKFKNSIAENERTIKINPGKNVQLNKFQKMNNYIDGISETIQKKLSTTEIAAVNTIKENVQNNIDKSMKSKFHVSIGENFQLNITTSTGHTIHGSDGGRGLTQLTSLSFVTALIAHSKNRANNKKTIFQPGTIAPFVIDAPFAEMDADNQSNALRFLLSQSHQIILFLSSGQWEDQFEDVVGNDIGKRYYFIDHAKEETGSTVKKLKIKGKDYALSDFNTDKPATEIMEII
jgi:DNA repair exonuclease SbcCD ATPase subunit